MTNGPIKKNPALLPPMLETYYRYITEQYVINSIRI
jgi:hypothetical protein